MPWKSCISTTSSGGRKSRSTRTTSFRFCEPFHRRARPDASRERLTSLVRDTAPDGWTNAALTGAERDMTIQAQITDYLAAQPERKRGDMQALHDMMLRVVPDGRLWFLDGRD